MSLPGAKGHPIRGGIPSANQSSKQSVRLHSAPPNPRYLVSMLASHPIQGGIPSAAEGMQTDGRMHAGVADHVHFTRLVEMTADKSRGIRRNRRRSRANADAPPHPPTPLRTNSGPPAPARRLRKSGRLAGSTAATTARVSGPTRRHRRPRRPRPPCQRPAGGPAPGTAARCSPRRASASTPAPRRPGPRI
jgi:hypothetical protein